MSRKKIVLISAISVVVIGALIAAMLAWVPLGGRDRNQDPSLKETTDEIGGPGQTQPTPGLTDPDERSSGLLLYADGPPSLDGFLQDPAVLIGTPGVDFKLLKMGSADDWADVPVPFVNPLGSRSLYNRVTYRSAGTSFVEMAYLEGFSQVSHRAYGELWEMRIRDSDLTPNFLRWYATELGATLYDNADDRIAFSVLEGDRLWWASAVWSSPDARETMLRVVKQDILPVGETLTITPSDTDGGYYSFSTLANSGDFLTAVVELEGSDNRAQVILTGSQLVNTGMLTRRFEYRKTLTLEHMNRYALNDIPQTDQPVYWRVNLSGSRVPDKVTIRFEKSGAIEPVKITDQLGSIRVIGAAGATKVSEQSSIDNISHSDGFSYYGKRDSDGNTVFYLPAGYYNINTNLPGGGNGGIRMIPVSGGERTDVIFPDEFKETYASLESVLGGFASNMGSISILNNDDFSDTAQAAILINDPLKRDVFPEKENIVILEGGEQAEILNITRETAPVNLVLVIDTSGSMRPYMATTIEAAKRFVDGLPDGVKIRLVSFERAITVHEGEGKDAVIRAIDTLVASGSTALYDATARSLELLQDMDNAFAVVFSDGADSREPGVSGNGSDLTQAQIVQRIGATDVTVLTIGFSEDHDPAALIAMSDANGKGAYFSALDETMLDQAFAAVSAKFGNQFIIDYKRPETAIDVRSQKPVISVMIDDSGSMGIFREGVISLFYDFFNGLPQDSLIQFSKFGEHVDLMHITTDLKAPLMQAMGERGQTDSGTKVIKALKASYEQIKPLPTDKKVFIFLSDEAMSEVTAGKNQHEAEQVFGRFREDGIRCLFIGVERANRVEASYQLAAELTGGEYLITNSLAEIDAALQNLLGRVSEPVIEGNYVNFSIGIRAPTEDGSIMDYYATRKLFDFEPRIGRTETAEPRTARIITGGRMLPLFDQKTAGLISGGGQVDGGTVVTNRISYANPEPEPFTPVPSVPLDSIEYNRTSNNKYLNITVRESFTFDVLGGVEAQGGRQFIALELDLAFPDQDTAIEAYQIPSISQHFYLSLNNGNPEPASRATWLAEKPLAQPGDNKISIKKGETISGLLVFYTEKPESIMQLGLHFYDTIHGHIHIPLTGKIQEHMAAIDALPQSRPTQITDAFSIQITGYADETQYGTYQPVIDKPATDAQVLRNTVLRNLQAVLDSQVQALLKLDPQKRFFYAIETDQGLMMSAMNSIVHNLPLGFTGNTLVAPGASNAVLLPYEIPAGLRDAAAHVFGDVKDADVALPVTDGQAVSTNSKGIRLSHEYFDVIINDLAPSPFRATAIILDITVVDKKDGFSTAGIHRAFALENKSESNDRNRYVEGSDGGLLYGIDTDWLAYDGQSRRGILEFSIRGSADPYVLRSIHFPELDLQIDNKTYSHPEFLAVRNDVPVNDSFEKALDKAVSAAVSQYRASRAATADKAMTIAFAQEDMSGAEVASPETSVFGRNVLDSVESEDDFFHLMYAISWRPAGTRQEYLYAPEAVISQQWGSQWDLIMLADSVAARLGLKTVYREVILTERGKEALTSISGIANLGRIEKLPALAYVNEDGENRIFVIPFMRDIRDLSGLVYMPSSQGSKRPTAASVKMTITALATGDPDQAGLGQGTLFDAFSKSTSGTAPDSGKRQEKEIILFAETLSIPSLSLGAIDIGYYTAVMSESGDDIVKVVVETTDGLLQGSQAIDTGKDDLKGVRIQMEFSGSPRDGYSHVTWLERGQKITDVCHTLAFALPEMTGKSLRALERERIEAVQSADEQINNASIVKWFHRSTVLRYIAARSDYDKDMAEKLDLVMGRVSLPMVVMMTSRSDGINAFTTLDLMHHGNQIHNGDQDSSNAYRLFSGMYASVLEGEAIADGTGINMLDLWKPASAGEGFLYIDESREARELALKSLAGSYPDRLLENIKKAVDTRSDTVFLIPKVPGEFNGEPRWAWLEIDSKTYDAISVFDTGERAGLAGYAMGLMSNKAVQGYVGFFIGVNCATWSISAYSLVMSDPKDIENAAAMLCAEILEQLKKMLGVTGGKTPVEYFGGYIKDNMAVKGVSISKIESLLSPEVEMPGFVEGFEAALEIYFN